MTLQLQNPLNIATARLLVEVPGTLFLIWRIFEEHPVTFSNTQKIQVSEFEMTL